MEVKQKVQAVVALLEDKKGEDIFIADMREREYLVEFVIIVTAMAGKHSYALLDYLKSELKSRGVVFYATDEESEDWLIADLGDVIVHIFTQNHRAKFNLEEFLQTLPKRVV